MISDRCAKQARYTDVNTVMDANYGIWIRAIDTKLELGLKTQAIEARLTLLATQARFTHTS